MACQYKGAAHAMAEGTQLNLRTVHALTRQLFHDGPV